MTLSCRFKLLCILAAAFAAGTANAEEPLFPVRDADAIVRAWQTDIDATLQTTGATAAGGGLVGVVVTSMMDSRANRKAEAGIIAIRERLADYPVGQAFTKKIVDDIDWALVVPEGTVNTAADLPDFENLPPTARTYLEVIPEVLFTTDMNALVVRIDVVSIAPPEAGSKKQQISSKQRYEFAWPITHLRKKMKPEEAAAAWAARSRDELIALIETGMDTSTTLWNYHLQNAELPKGEGLWNPLYTASVQYAKKLDQRGDMVWLRRTSNSTWLHAVHRDVFWARVPAQQ